MKNVQDIIRYKQNLTSACCIYFLIDKNEIVYVGKSTKGAFDRLGAHFKYSDKVFDSYFIEPCLEINLTALETEYILKFVPKYNKSLPSNKIYTTKNRIMSNFKIWSSKTFSQIIRDNKIQIYGGKYFKIADFRIEGV